jgi:hypothetical protein
MTWNLNRRKGSGRGHICTFGALCRSARTGIRWNSTAGSTVTFFRLLRLRRNLPGNRSDPARARQANARPLHAAAPEARGSGNVPAASRRHPHYRLEQRPYLVAALPCRGHPRRGRKRTETGTETGTQLLYRLAHDGNGDATIISTGTRRKRGRNYYIDWHTITNLPTGPTQDVRQGWANSSVETRTMRPRPTSAAPRSFRSGDGRLSGSGERIDQGQREGFGSGRQEVAGRLSGFQAHQLQRRCVRSLSPSPLLNRCFQRLANQKRTWQQT